MMARLMKTKAVRAFRPLFLILLVSLGSGCTPIVWRGDLHRALDLAAREDRMVVVWYWKPADATCDQMERTVFRSEEVVKEMEGTIPVRLHATFSKRWARDNEITEVPSFVAIGPNGQVLRKRGGPMDTDQFLAFLSVARLSP